MDQQRVSCSDPEGDSLEGSSPKSDSLGRTHVTALRVTRYIATRRTSESLERGEYLCLSSCRFLWIPVGSCRFCSIHFQFIHFELSPLSARQHLSHDSAFRRPRSFPKYLPVFLFGVLFFHGLKPLASLH